MEAVFARQEHGGYKVIRKQDTTIVVNWPTGQRIYDSVRKTIRALINNDPDLIKDAYKKFNYCWDRYFRLGKYRKVMSPVLDTLTLFGNKSLATGRSNIKRNKTLTVVDQPVTGIDLNKRGHEVKKLFYSGFKDKVVALGYNPEDVLQEVYLGILQRNRTKGCFDPSRSAFSSYVFMVCGCVISNYNRKHKKFFSETIGTFDANGEIVDVSESNLPVFYDTVIDQKDLQEALTEQITHKAKRIRKFTEEKVQAALPLVFKGYKNKEISDITGISVNWVSSFIKFVKANTMQLTQGC